LTRRKRVIAELGESQPSYLLLLLAPFFLSTTIFLSSELEIILYSAKKLKHSKPEDEPSMVGN
jgi:hypothetical protein